MTRFTRVQDPELPELRLRVERFVVDGSAYTEIVEERARRGTERTANAHFVVEEAVSLNDLDLEWLHGAIGQILAQRALDRIPQHDPTGSSVPEVDLVPIGEDES